MSSRISLIQHPFFRSRIFRQRWLRHVVFWTLYVTFYALVGGGYSFAELGQAFSAELILLPLKILVVYLTLYWLIPKQMLEGKMVLFFLGALGLIVGSAFGQRALIYYVLYPIQYPGLPYGEFVNTVQIVRYGLTILSVLVLTSGIKIVQYWYQDQQTAKAMVKAKLEAELKFLKAQIHPHFLFNTLNNLYALTLKKSDRAPEVVLRLSELVNYMLYEASASGVPLSKEIETIHNYIALERIRYRDNLDIYFQTSGDIGQAQIAPLLLLPFVENSFKHGVSDEVADKWISLNLNLNFPHLVFKVENSRSRPNGERREKDYAGGIGLKNVKRRLELLYPDRYELKIKEEPDSYFISLSIDLSEPARVLADISVLDMED